MDSFIPSSTVALWNKKSPARVYTCTKCVTLAKIARIPKRQPSAASTCTTCKSLRGSVSASNRCGAHFGSDLRGSGGSQPCFKLGLRKWAQKLHLASGDVIKCTLNLHSAVLQ